MADNLTVEQRKKNMQHIKSKDTKIEIALMISSVLLVMAVELLNSAVEAVVDRIGTERHELSGRAKDQGSAAVFIALCIVVVVWGSILFF